MSSRPQFSIKGILAITALAALAFWVMTAEQSWYAAIVEAKRFSSYVALIQEGTEPNMAGKSRTSKVESTGKE